MKKNRNSFFADNSMNYAGFNPMVNNNGYQMSANSSFYSDMSINNMDINQRLAKLERQVNRLEHRINKLEGQKMQSTNDYDNSNDYYMI